MKLRTTIHSLAAAGLLCSGGCAFITGLAGAGGADSSAFTVDMEGYDVKKIGLTRPDATDAKAGICPGTSVKFKVTADAVYKKKNERTMLETADAESSGKDARGKMDLTEFALAARGGSIENGVFTASSDPFAALLGYDVKATFRLDKTKVVSRHYAPEYSCLSAVGVSGPSGSSGDSGQTGEQNGGAGGAGGPGEPGGPGPQLTVHASIIETPLYEKVGIIKVSGGAEQLSVFDLSAGVLVVANGGSGGSGGYGGRGGQGAKPKGAGGSGGPGGNGAAGGDGGQVVVIIDDRFPELADAIRVDVSGGSPGGAGAGGDGGDGAPSYRPDNCPNCDMVEAGPKGPDGPSGQGSNQAGRDGTKELQRSDVSSQFSSLPPGVRLKGGARPEPEAAPPPPPPPTKKGKKKSG